MFWVRIIFNITQPFLNTPHLSSKISNKKNFLPACIYVLLATSYTKDMKGKLMTLFALLTILVSTNSCEKEHPDNWQTLRQLHKTFKNGEIDECIYNGQIVFCAGLNAYDAGSSVFDKDGNIIGRCNYAWTKVDSICRQLKECEVVYRVKNNIWGLPAVDKYGLGK